VPIGVKRDPKVVSYTMSRIRSRDTSIEVSLRRALWTAGHRYRVNVRGLPGTPDIAFLKARVAVFCDSSFWHGRNWQAKKARLITNRQFWIAKIERNMHRDIRVSDELRAIGWHVIRFWDEEIQRDLDKCVDQIVVILRSRVAVGG
jgi:DNA mismatch endonuclease (patch repair protein)